MKSSSSVAGWGCGCVACRASCRNRRSSRRPAAPSRTLPKTFRRLIAADELVLYPYDGFWAPMDTLKDKEALEALVSNGGSVWQVWEQLPAASAG